MESDYWHQRWTEGNPTFNQTEANPLFVRNYSSLGLAEGNRVFVPLCGKSVDIHWLLDQGVGVVGAELSEVAVKGLFEELQLEPAVEDHGDLKLYKAGKLEVFLGDIFKLTPELLGPVDGVYDRAALVAFPEDVRPDYVNHLAALGGQAPQLVITFVYDQTEMDGPPFAVSASEAKRLYADTHEAERLEHTQLKAGIRDYHPIFETVWLFRRTA